jgi:hypothetical protein
MPDINALILRLGAGIESSSLIDEQELLDALLDQLDASASSEGLGLDAEAWDGLVKWTFERRFGWSENSGATSACDLRRTLLRTPSPALCCSAVCNNGALDCACHPDTARLAWKLSWVHLTFSPCPGIQRSGEWVPPAILPSCGLHRASTLMPAPHPEAALAGDGRWRQPTNGGQSREAAHQRLPRSGRVPLSVGRPARTADAGRLAGQFIEMLKQQPLAPELLHAFGRTAHESSKPVVRQRCFLHVYAWVKLQGARDAAFARRLEGALAELLCLLLASLTDVWSATRKASAQRLGDVAALLSVPQLEALVDALFETYASAEHAQAGGEHRDAWRVREVCTGPGLWHLPLCRRVLAVLCVCAGAD